MSGKERFNRFVDALVHEHRPPRFPADSDEEAAMVAAAALKAARPGADLPRPEFIQELERRLAEELDGTASAGGWSRRRLFQLTGAAAAAVVAGIGIDRVLPRQDTSGATAQRDLAIANARWVAVVPLAAVTPNTAVRFSAGAVEGFVVNRGGSLHALSAVCTHMGCIVHFNQARSSLDCPCHGASFALDGSPINHDYLQSLPRLASRVRGDMIEVQVSSEA